MLNKLKARAEILRLDIYTLYLAARHPHTPLLPKLLIVLVVAYAASPIDLIPDFIPVIGYLDDLLLLPAGIWLAIRLVPAEILQDCRNKALTMQQHIPPNYITAALIIGIWTAVAGLITYQLFIR
ncbi:MAG: YkvA family protein [Gammaproteobacteria bacterium]|nr:YkvA family protein [Gammaproteobacteria bacterium]MDH5650435.1 YkvA family protein [Gammaproteobacteria bacterium]